MSKQFKVGDRVVLRGTFDEECVGVSVIKTGKNSIYVPKSELEHDNSPPPSTSSDPRVAELAALIDDLLEASRYVQVSPSHVQDCARRAKFRAQCLLENKGGGA